MKLSHCTLAVFLTYYLIDLIPVAILQPALPSLLGADCSVGLLNQTTKNASLASENCYRTAKV